MTVARSRRLLLDIVLRRCRPGSGSRLDELMGAPRMRDDAWALAEAARGSVPHAVIGGVATARYMPQRATLDLDLVVVAGDASRAQAALAAAGYARSGDRSGGSSWCSPAGAPLDVLYLEDPWAETALAAAMAAVDPDLGLPVLALPHLVLLQLRSGRLQDVADIGRLLGFAAPEALHAVRETVSRHGTREGAEDLESMIALGRLEHRDPGPAT